MRRKIGFCFCALLAFLLCLMVPELASAQRRNSAAVGGNLLPDGFYITPTAAPGSIFQDLPTGLRPDGSANANGAVNTALSPDGTALLILTTGFNTDFFYQGTSGLLWDPLEPNLQPYVAPIPGILCQPPVDPNLVPEARELDNARLDCLRERLSTVYVPLWVPLYVHRTTTHSPSATEFSVVSLTSGKLILISPNTVRTPARPTFLP
jgi:hypothetical protein